MSSPDPIAEFIDDMARDSIVPAEPIASRLGSGLIRFACEGDGRGKRNGWATIYLDGVPAGAYGNYRLGVRRKWRSGRSAPLSSEERRKWRDELARRKAAREAETKAMQERVAGQAAVLWRDATPASPDHPYLKAKRIAGEGLRQSGDVLLVPMRDADGRLWNVQRIQPDGFKAFGPPGAKRGEGGRVDGLYWACGEPVERICIGEGMATMAAVRRATGSAVAAAINADNLLAVARILRAKFPGLPLVICGDDDAALEAHPHIKRNLGKEKASAAAEAVGAGLALPPAENRI